MARTAIALTAVTRAGVAPPAESTVDTANGNTIPNNGGVVLLARNSNGASTARTLTVALTGTVDGQTISPRSYSIPAGASRYIGPFPIGSYGYNLLVNGDNAELKVIALQFG